ncbi:MAG: DnaJ domain-containing protein [Candidatus Omnitrophica bacterium]|nr:DnaJ domain-containing protein [Candidatus Omnitrophota bacterium]MCF7894455.1 DnaJ domain-containing protein [Candidatus Omnitrophota bacterium]
MKKDSFQIIDKARKILELDIEATVGEVKKSYERLAKNYHPDRCQENKQACEERFKEISWAYDIIMSYIERFRISFHKKDIKKMDMDKITYRHLKQFYDGWWSDLDI